MKRALRRGLAAAALFTALAVTVPANAQVSSDAGLIVQLIAQEQQAVGQLKMILSTLQGQVQLIQQFVQGQPQGELDAVSGILQGTQANYASLVGNLQTIGYTLGAVNADYTTTFPNATAAQGIAPSNYATLESNWQQEILASSEIAARSQSSISETEALTQAAAQIMAYVGGTDSAVGQLQLVVQMLGVVQSQMTMLVQNLATTGRAMVDTGAATASERNISTERKRRNRINYTSRGASVNVPGTLP
jgi:conjugal transfer/entry exclusion protein